MSECFWANFRIGGGVLLPLFALVFAALPATAAIDCARVLGHHKDANTEHSLRVIVDACPGNAAALNNLAVN